MCSWISRKQALQEAQVTVFDAKRYLTVFCRFVPPDSVLRGSQVASMVPHVLANFKLMENSGLTIEQIEQILSETLDIHKVSGGFPCDSKDTNNAICNKEKTPNLMVTFAKILQNQAEMQKDIIRIFNTELTTLRERLVELEKTMTILNKI